MQIFNVPIKSKDTEFLLSDEGNYQQWRTQKLSAYPAQAGDLLVQIGNPLHICETEQAEIRDRILRFNMAVYQLDDPDQDQYENKEVVRQMGRQFGLEHLDANLCADEDSISSIQLMPDGRKQGYIPYSNMKLSWHTDGYYNPPEQTIRAMMLHCARPATEGGENYLLDHEMAYIHLRDTDPAYISALMQPDVMTIPPNIDNGIELRGAQSGPVFSFDAMSGSLHMRYTHRMRSIEWKQDSLTKEAVVCLRELLESDSPWIFRHRLEAGQGLICNNVLHARTAFKDDAHTDAGRLLYRARYFDRIAST